MGAPIACDSKVAGSSLVKTFAQSREHQVGGDEADKVPEAQCTRGEEADAVPVNSSFKLLEGATHAAQYSALAVAHRVWREPDMNRNAS
jgi:hypothetical protein